MGTQPILDHHRRVRRDLDHLMPLKPGFLPQQRGTAVAIRIQVVLQHLNRPIDCQQASQAPYQDGVVWLPCWRPLAFRCSDGLNPRPLPLLAGALEELLDERQILNRRLASSSAMVFELGTENLDLLLLKQDQCSVGERNRQPVCL